MMELPTLIDSDETESCDTHSLEEIESPFAWELRVMLISAVWMLPGFIFGLLVRLCVPEGGPAEFWLVGGGVFGAIAGGFLEAEHWLG
jgi:hypothetical protein